MKSSVVTELPLSPEKARTLIRKLAVDSFNVAFTDHAVERMEQRGFDDSDVLLVLRTGDIDGKGEFDKAKNSWKYKVTKPFGIRNAGVVTAIVRESKLVIVTVEWEDWK